MNIKAKDLKDRSTEIGGCWIWTQGTTGNGYPQMKVVGCKTTLVRRMAAMLAGHELDGRAPVDMTCDERLCVNPKHTQPSTTKAVSAKAAERGAFSTVQRSARIAAAKRAGRVKLSDEQVAEIRASTEPETVLSPKYGVHRSYIGRIRRGTDRKDYSNPFAGLGAR
jgi:hypothetical protein